MSNPPDDQGWDAFVEANPLGSYMQTRAWAQVKRPNGWEPVDVRAGEGPTEIGALDGLLRFLDGIGVGEAVLVGGFLVEDEPDACGFGVVFGEPGAPGFAGFGVDRGRLARGHSVIRGRRVVR